MALALCGPCRSRGRLSIARRAVAGELMCDECFGGKPSKGVATALFVEEEAAAAVKEKKEKPMKATDEATKETIRKDVSEGGLSISAAAKKSGVSWITAKNILDGNGKKSAGGGASQKRCGRDERPSETERGKNFWRRDAKRHGGIVRRDLERVAAGEEGGAAESAC